MEVKYYVCNHCGNIIEEVKLMRYGDVITENK